jgi:hypothetical protein
MADTKARVVLRATYFVETPELWYLLGKTLLNFRAEGLFDVYLAQHFDLNDDGEMAPTDDTKFTFDHYASVSESLAGVIDTFPTVEEFDLWQRSDAVLRETAPIAALPSKRGLKSIETWVWEELERHRQALDTHALNVISSLCWRLGIHDGPSTLTSAIPRIKVWRESGKMRIPPVITVPSFEEIFGEDRTVTDSALETVVDAVKQECSAPLDHVMFQEAWRRRGGEPRVAIVMAIAAAETATKRLVVHHLPDTQWLLENVQSPPIVTIIKKLLPTFRAPIGSSCVLVPKTIIAPLEKGVTLRNRIVHGRNETISHADSLRLLETIRDFLALVDFYTGQGWALELVSKTNRAALEKEVLLSAAN